MSVSNATTLRHKQAAFIFYSYSARQDDGSRAAGSGK